MSATIGAKPKNDIDLRLTPTNPISEFQSLEGVTPAGNAFIEEVWRSDRVQSGRQLQIFKAASEQQGLTFETDWSCVVTTMIDYDE